LEEAFRFSLHQPNWNPNHCSLLRFWYLGLFSISKKH
jgi:hypothetical protein